MFLYLNCDSSRTTGDRGIRRALAAAIDTEMLRAELDQPYPLHSPIIRSQLDLVYPEAATYDPEAARDLVAELDKSTPLTIAAPDTEPYLTIAARVQAVAESLGYTTHLVSSPSQDLILSTIRPREYDILVYETNLGTDSDPFAYYHSSSASESGFNLSNYRSAIADDALVSTRTSLDAGLRTAKYNSFLRTWASDVPAIPLYQSSIDYYYNKNLRAFSDDATLVEPLDRFNDVASWAVNRNTRLRTP
jgi:ABC-type transport system substrate-binding protein